MGLRFMRVYSPPQADKYIFVSAMTDRLVWRKSVVVKGKNRK
jgi:hypothetical protein